MLMSVGCEMARCIDTYVLPFSYIPLPWSTKERRDTTGGFTKGTTQLAKLSFNHSIGPTQL